MKKVIILLALLFLFGGCNEAVSDKNKQTGADDKKNASDLINKNESAESNKPAKYTKVEVKLN